MFTDFVRDHAFTIAWFGLMAFVWFGWGQEDPRPALRPWLGAGSVMGLLLAGFFGYGVFARWGEGSALEGRYPWFGLVVGLEVLLAGVGCLFLHRRGKGRWMAWWVALVVALHFVPLAFFLDDLSLAGLGIIEAAGLAALVPRVGGEVVSSRLAGPWMGITLLVFAGVSALLFVVRTGTPW